MFNSIEITTEQLVKEALKHVSKEQWEEFIEERFLKPLLSNLDSLAITAEEFKQRRKQTINIKNILLTLRDK